MKNRLRLSLLAACLIGVFLIAAGYLTLAANAAPAIQETTPTLPPEQLSIANEVCLGCHGQPGQSYALENEDLLDLSVNPEEYAASVHGAGGYACVQCHNRVGEYPHPPFQAANLRDATLQLNESCQRCHQHQVELAQDSVHATALQSGNLEAATCSDCHGAHNTRRLNDPQTRRLTTEARAWIPQTCARCHSLIYEKYQGSVHGSALLDESNPDVPTCIDCHGVHNIEDPRTAAFRLRSPQICARCHTDPKVVGKYGLSTEVLNTYVADFHGSTVVIFERQTPDAETNKPVCYDCHGIHDISRADDPQKGLQVRENLLARCQVCHPDATSNFPEAWLSHYIPSPENAPLVYYVNLFYKLFIPGVLGFMAILVVMDASRMALNLSRQKRQPVVSVNEGEAGSQAQNEPAIGEPESDEPVADTPPVTAEVDVAAEMIEPVEAATGELPEAELPLEAKPESTADPSIESNAEDQPGAEVGHD